MGVRVGLDIGYSNVITVFGPEDGLHESVEIGPAQATPLNLLPRDAGLRAGEVVVEVDGEPWLAFAAPGRAQGGRELHEDYTASKAYEALFKGALLNAAGETDVIEKLVTGLPVHLALDDGCVERLRSKMIGKHRVSKLREIEVLDVDVIAQPLGALSEIYVAGEHSSVIDESTVLVIDPGFFSVDWVLFDNRELVKQSSNSSLKAMSVLLEACNHEIAKDFGGVPGIEKIEQALQNDRDYILLFGKKVELAKYLDFAAETVVPAVLTEIKQGLRFLKGRAIDCIVLAGGGARFYESYVRNEFPGALVVMPADSVASNARGFKQLACF